MTEIAQVIRRFEMHTYTGCRLTELVAEFDRVGAPDCVTSRLVPVMQAFQTGTRQVATKWLVECKAKFIHNGEHVWTASVDVDGAHVAISVRLFIEQGEIVWVT